MTVNMLPDLRSNVAGTSPTSQRASLSQSLFAVGDSSIFGAHPPRPIVLVPSGENPAFGFGGGTGIGVPFIDAISLWTFNSAAAAGSTFSTTGFGMVVILFIVFSHSATPMARLDLAKP